jgi:hypothetical protein
MEEVAKEEPATSTLMMKPDQQLRESLKRAVKRFILVRLAGRPYNRWDRCWNGSAQWRWLELARQAYRRPQKKRTGHPPKREAGSPIVLERTPIKMPGHKIPLESLAGNYAIWLRYADSLPWVQGSLDDSSWKAFLRAHSLGVKQETALEYVTDRITEAGDFPREGKLESQILRAYQDWDGTSAGPRKRSAASPHPKPSKPPKPPKPPKLQLRPDFVARMAARVGGYFCREWLKARSPVSLGVQPEQYLSELFESGEKAIIFDDQKSQGQELWKPGVSLARFVKGKKNGVWFLIQPVDGGWRYNPRQGHDSRRSEEAVTAWRYLLLESDCVDKLDWLKILVQLPLPIVSITDSGGGSLHALVYFDAPSKAWWDEVKDDLKQWVIPLGACKGSLSAVRLSRLPNCYRDDKLQELLWLDSQAKARGFDGSSILGRISRGQGQT